MIRADERNPVARAVAAGLRSAWPEVDAAEIVYVIGGDGFFLASVHELGFDRSYLGLNAGRLGFLLNDVVGPDGGPRADVVERLRAGAVKVRELPLLEARVRRFDGSEQVELAVNDVYLERMTGQTARLSLWLGGDRMDSVLVADGIIFATPVGSTGYSFSAGGPALDPRVAALAVTPICAHTPRLPPLVLPATARPRVEVVHPERRPVRAVVDGRAIDHVVAVEVTTGSRCVRVGWLDNHDFTRCLVDKLLRP